jgi:hypothetical protein
MLTLTEDVVEPTPKVRFEPIGPPEDEAYIAVFPSAIELGLVDVTEPGKWKEVVYLGSHLHCIPDDSADLEQRLIPEATRTSPSYSGYWFWLALTSIGTDIELIEAGLEIDLQPRSTLLATQSFECFGVRADGIAVNCRVPSETLLFSRHAIEKRHPVRGFELTQRGFTWWQRQPEGHVPEGWTQVERECPSCFLADCDSRFRSSVQSDRDWEALLIPTQLLGRTVVVL